MNWLALDIGGANLKVADGNRFAESYSFPLWRDPNGLSQQVRTIISEAPKSDHLAVTMTGELADCFENKAAGVRHILRMVGEGSDNRHTRVYLVDGRMVAPQVAVTLPHLAAASNWHALARFAGRFAKTGAALLLDVGSTTSDVIPLQDGLPIAKGKSDTERLLSGELFYTGVERSPACAVAHSVLYRGRQCPLAQEVFATMRDAYLLLGAIPEDPADHHTADGRPATKAAAKVRIGRSIAGDSEEVNHRDAAGIAQCLADAQAAQLASAIQKVVSAMPGPPEKIILSGHGEFLAVNALRVANLRAKTLSLREELGSALARVGPAHALAVLAREATSP
jgi:(4-(4-[2-(gamma-L-glutamylamino)ethyl]phenoxymethyl)furan-2-yl)methanamine synthase